MSASDPATPDLDPARIARILGASAVDGGLALTVEDPGGRVLGSSDAMLDGGPTGPPQRFDIKVGGVVVGRLVAYAAPEDPTTVALLGTLAASLGELASTDADRQAADAALAAERAARSASALGTDVGELAKGRRQQRSILSLVPPDLPGYELASHYAAAREIGGDFFELFRLQRRGHPLGIVIADVTGKGLDAALLMAFTRPVMHSALQGARGPAEALERTNRVLVGERRGTLFVTALAAVLAPGSGRLRVASAGHEPPFLVPADGSEIRAVGGSGVLLGAFGRLEATETEVDLAPGDALVLYTDGATDAQGPDGGRFGEDRLVATVEAARGLDAAAMVAAVRTAIERFQGVVEPADDLTLVVVRRSPGTGRRSARRSRSASDRTPAAAPG